MAVTTTLALGLGTNTAVFSVIDGTFRATDWWADEERTLALWPGNEFSRGQLYIFQTDTQAFDVMGVYRLDAFTAAAGGGEPTSVSGAYISPELFEQLRVQPHLGRGFLVEEAQPGGEPPVVVSHGFWERELGGDPTALGSRIDINGVPRTIVGIQGEGGRAPGKATDVWVPALLNPADPDFFPDISYAMVGVLRPGATAQDGQATLRSLGRRLSEMFPFFYRPDYMQDATVRVARAEQRDMLRTPLFMLMGGTVMLLLIGALNIGNMLIARAIERRKELAVRRAMGAERGRLIRQLATESAFLAVLGTVGGVAVAAPAAGALAGLFPPEVAVVRSSWTSPAVLVFLTASTLLSWFVLTAVPIAAFVAADRRGVHSNIRPRGGQPRVLISVQSALATILLVAAVLLIQSVANLRDVPLGFDPAGVTAAYVSPPTDLVRDRSQLAALQTELVARAAALPGVSSAGMTAVLPLDQTAPVTPVNPEGAQVEVNVAVRADRFAVDEGFFKAMGVDLMSGRLLGSTERSDEPSAVLVNRTLADMLWPGQDPVGRTVAIDPHAWETFLPVVGVVADFRSDDLIGPERPALFVSLREQGEGRAALVVRATGPAAGVGAALRRLVADTDPSVAVGAVRPLAGVVRDAYGIAWVTMGLLAAMAALATGLAGVGIHAVLANDVARRRRDIGVRLALGARRWDVVSRILRSGLTFALIGVAVGTVAAAAGVRLLEALLFGVDALSAMAFGAPAAGVLVAAMLAALSPALRAGRTAPATVLREE